MALAMHRRLTKELPQLASKTLLNDGLAVDAGTDIAALLAGIPEKPDVASKGASKSKKSADVARLIVLLAGPKGSPYEGGVFRLAVSVPSQYPLEPPKMKFESKIFHPNVGRGHTPGAICIDILRKEAWSPALTIERTLLSIASLLADPNPSSPMDSEAASLFTKNRKAYDERVREWVSNYARPDAAASSEGAWISDFGKADETVDAGAEAAPVPPVQAREEKPKVPKRIVESNATGGEIIDLESSDDEPVPKRVRANGA
jgi:ubiquitin-protein ligase